LNWAVALSKKARNIPRNDPRFNSEAVSDECFEKAMQKFRAAAALKPNSWEIHFDWGNIYYRQAFMKIEQYIKRLRSAHNNNEQRKQSSIDCNQSEEKKDYEVGSEHSTRKGSTKVSKNNRTETEILSNTV